MSITAANFGDTNSDVLKSGYWDRMGYNQPESFAIW